MSATPPATRPSSRCSATSRSGTTSRSRAIPYAWELLTRDFALPKDRLVVTVYHDDDVAAELWKKVAGLPDERIIRIATSDNFWMMGPTGPCGPCSEIFYDHGPSIPGGPPGSPDEDGDRFIEIWNLVFMQFEQHEDGARDPLPRPSIDTGMGLERVGAVLQGKHDNFDTDLMRALIEASANATDGAPDGPGPHPPPGDRGPPALDLVPDRRRRPALERGPRLRAAPDRHAPRDAPRPPARGAGSGDVALGSGAGRADGRRLPRAAPRRGADRGVPAQRGDPLQGHPRARPCASSTTSFGRLPEGAPLPGAAAFRLYDTFGYPLTERCRTAARRHRGGPTSPASTRHWPGRRRRRARPGPESGEAADEGIWFDLAEKHGLPSSSATTPRPPRAGGAGADRRRPRGRDGAGRRRGAGRLEPDAVLRRSRRPGRRYRQAPDRPRPRRDHDVRRKAGVYVHVGRVEEGELLRGARGRARRSTTAAARQSAPTTRRLTSCTRRCAGRSATTSRSAAVFVARPAALRLRPRQGDQPGRARGRRGRGQRLRPD